MDDKQLTELAQHLSALAGMKMEDIAPLALVRSHEQASRTAIALQLRDESRSVSMLLEAAAYLLEQADELGSSNQIE